MAKISWKTYRELIKINMYRYLGSMSIRESFLVVSLALGLICMFPVINMIWDKQPPDFDDFILELIFLPIAILSFYIWSRRKIRFSEFVQWFKGLGVRIEREVKPNVSGFIDRDIYFRAFLPSDFFTNKFKPIYISLLSQCYSPYNIKAIVKKKRSLLKGSFLDWYPLTGESLDDEFKEIVEEILQSIEHLKLWLILDKHFLYIGVFGDTLSRQEIKENIINSIGFSQELRDKLIKNLSEREEETQDSTWIDKREEIIYNYDLMIRNIKLTPSMLWFMIT